MKQARRERALAEARAEKDVAWFYGTLAGRVDNAPAETREAAGEIDAALLSILTFHRGALSLRFRKKDWPDDLYEEFGNATSLVVRLACAANPSVGPTTMIEAAAVERLVACIARGGAEDADLLARLDVRAMRHVRLAIRAFAKARGILSKRAPVSGVVLTGDATVSA
jgi:hypothetical protein